MAFIVDTSAIIELERGSGDWNELLNRAGNESIYLSSVCWAELLAGVHLADSAQRALSRRKKLEALETNISILPFTQEIAEVWAEIFSELQRNGTPIPANDLAIAATAVFHKCTLLIGGKDEVHFRKIKRLRVEVV